MVGMGREVPDVSTYFRDTRSRWHVEGVEHGLKPAIAKILRKVIQMSCISISTADFFM